MRPRSRKNSSFRKSSGSSMSEFGPALFLLLIFFFLPMVDLLSLGVSYGLCVVLNGDQTREASLSPYLEATDPSGRVKKGIPDQWMNGMGRFTKLSGLPNTEVAYKSGEPGSDGVADKIVGVRTTVVCNPFLSIPLPLVNVPGLNGPMTFQIVSQRTMENPDYAKPL